MGHVDGGAGTVVDALLGILGPHGTLAVPTFTFSHGRQARLGETAPVLDLTRDPSEMGRISERVRMLPGTRRSRHLLHSVAAVGPLAEELTAIHGPSAWAGDSPFWKLYEMGARILLLGVPYLRCTFFHVVEQLVQATYRRWVDIEARLREPDGTERPLPTRAYVPAAGFQGNDFNKLGALLESRGMSTAGAVGNAVARLFDARDAFDAGLAEYRKDPLLFVQTGESLTALRDGVMAGEPDDEKAVLDPAGMFGARPDVR